MKLEIVVGAQFGSEAKGHVVQRLTERAIREGNTPMVIRVAGPNAGHTGHDASGQPWALRQVPVAAVVDGPVVLGIGAGSEIDLPVLVDEIERLRAAGLLKHKMLWVHGEATLITTEHKTLENGLPHHPGQALDDLVERLGSTGKGIGAARAERLMRRADRVKDSARACDELGKLGVGIAYGDENPILMRNHVIIEGTQGYGLGLHAGFYPQCTSSDCRAVDFMAMAGLSPWEFDEVEVWAVARIFPIRVAGNSGPLKDETSWEALGLPDEKTTVTKKIRRVGLPDWDLVAKAVEANGGAPAVRLAITMVDQMFPKMKDRTIWDESSIDEFQFTEVSRYLKDVQELTNAPIGLVTTGPNTASWILEGTL